MQGYKAKTLIDGFKVDNNLSGKKLIAVPLNKAIFGNLVFYGNQLMRIKTESLTQITFPDKYGRGAYTLCYYEWVPEKIW